MFIAPFVSEKFCFNPGTIVCFACESEDTKGQVLVIGFHFVLFAMTYPVIIFCYYKVFRKVRTHFAQIADAGFHDDSAKSFAEEVKITKILFAVLVAFLICWTPAFTIEILDTLKGKYTLQRQVYLIFSFSAMANGAINPVIYVWMQKGFRDAYKNILTCAGN